MNPKIVLAAFVAATLLAALGALTLIRQQPAAAGEFYQVRGVIESIDHTENSTRIRHEEVSGYMPAMVMPFSVKDSALLTQIQPGDEVLFRLEVTEDDSWISRFITVTTPAATPGEISAAEPLTPEMQRLQPGETVPPFRLTGQNGQPIDSSSYRGKALLVTFIYTRCPLPNYCPFLSQSFAELQQRLAQEFPGQFQLLSITIDPEVDTPSILKSYGMRYGADESTWTFATGSLDEITRVSEWFGLTREVAGGLINHDLRTALISPEGKLVHVWKSNAWTPYEVQRSVRQVLTGSIDVARK